jgi:hypothetical protein
MKYWTELTAVESELIRLESLKSLTTVVANGIESSNYTDVENAIWHLLGSLEDISEKSYDAYNALFGIIRADNIESDKPDYDFQPLESVVNVWAKAE